ncbi:hypothetical protein COCON_G00109910 [Conger conger]|uniref:Uncharacterized protein n=1 Tax=Conger conger TaxID=82655 RepID=A0A9Q1DJI4_CONCO|nr:hypothetical protein COCON_G00109910 [Conger conger]
MADSLLLRVKLVSASASGTPALKHAFIATLDLTLEPIRRLPVQLSLLESLITQTSTGCAWVWHSGLPLFCGDCFSSSTAKTCMNIKRGMDLSSRSPSGKTKSVEVKVC